MRDKYDWAGKPSTDSAEVMQQYDEMAPTYDATLLQDWGYRAPAVAAELLARYVGLDSTVLDVGCGTGLTGAELKRVGFTSLQGTDISQPSLQAAANKNVYESLVRANLMEPLPFADDSFHAALCVGVLSYITGDGLFRELCRGQAQPGNEGGDPGFEDERPGLCEIVLLVWRPESDARGRSGAVHHGAGLFLHRHAREEICRPGCARQAPVLVRLQHSVAVQVAKLQAIFMDEGNRASAKMRLHPARVGRGVASGGSACQEQRDARRAREPVLVGHDLTIARLQTIAEI